MAAPRFDPVHSVEIDLARGTLAVRDGGARVLLPVGALSALLGAASPEARKDFARRLGTEAGRRVALRLGDASASAVEVVLEHLGGDLALLGLGSLGIERWGRALVFTVTGSPLRADGDELLAWVLEGALQRCFGRDTSIVRLSRDDAQVRFFVSSVAAGERVRQLLDSGTPWGAVLSRMHARARRGEA